MKVYELMNLLSECPAGANIEIHQLISISELIQGGVAQEMEGKEYYSYNSKPAEIGDIPENGNGTVCIYTD